MGLLDSLLGQVLGGMAQHVGRGGLSDVTRSGGASGAAGITALIAIALQLLQRSGGLEGVLGRLQQQGHGREADSWVGTGANLPISPDVLSQIFGRDEVGRAAEQLGVSPDEAANDLASVFPEVVNQMTPQGRIEIGSDDVVARALDELARSRR
jgi:uncharacterized protein YidB (DUF937 family)